MNVFTGRWRLADNISFTSRIDSKGRALLSAEIRRKLGLKYGSKIIVSEASEFTAVTDERGRFVVPAFLRKDCKIISGSVRIMAAVVQRKNRGLWTPKPGFDSSFRLAKIPAAALRKSEVIKWVD